MNETNFKYFVQDLMKQKGVKQWEAAKQMGIGETTLTRWLRGDLPKDKCNQIVEAVNAVALKKEGSSHD